MISALHGVSAVRAGHASHPTQKGLLYAREDGVSYLATANKFLEIVADSPKMKKDLVAAAKASQGRSLLAVVEGRVARLSGREVFMATSVKSKEAVRGYSGVVRQGRAGLTLTNTQGTFQLKPMTKQAKQQFAAGLTNYHPPPVFVGKRVGKTIEVWDVNLAMHIRPA